jgi:hypothetical protein
LPKLGAFSREVVLGRPDWRSKEGRLWSQVYRRLRDELGGKLTPRQELLVLRASNLHLRLAVFDRKFEEGTFSEYDSKVYLAFNNSLVRTLAVLGLETGALPAKPLRFRTEQQRERNVKQTLDLIRGLRD